MPPMDEKTKARQKAYHDRTFDKISVRFFPKGEYLTIKEEANIMGYTSMNQFIIDAIEEKIAGGVRNDG